MTRELNGISSMATRAVLADLVAAYTQQTGRSARIESVGGVDAARRVQSGEAFDLVFLAAQAIEKLRDSGHVLPDSQVDLMRSGVSVAVRHGALQPDISTEETLRDAVRSASSIGYSTGPSGVALSRLFERWGIAQEIAPRIVQVPPGVPVGALVADGRVALGFQQTSELMHIGGIALLGPLPSAIQIVTTFSAGVCSAGTEPGAARELLAFMASAQATDAKRKQGMEPV